MGKKFFFAQVEHDLGKHPVCQDFTLCIAKENIKLLSPDLTKAHERQGESYHFSFVIWVGWLKISFFMSSLRFFAMHQINT